jgi:lipopolysaccharide transport system ATP-binding protein
VKPGLAIRAAGLSKEYRLGETIQGYRTARDRLAELAATCLGRRSPRAGRKETVWAVRDVSFEIPQGAAVGVIGRNGAGKSTLLKILSGVTEPTAGHAEVRGRVGSLLEVGTGFHPELTGRENVFLNGAILGMRRREIARKFDAIVDFAEVERFLDTPVKHYSSGMHLRLAFAVAAHLEPEILLVDEVLAVGDMLFQRKCLEKMRGIGARGQTVVFVSHDLSIVSRLASTSLVLDAGRVAFFGPTEEAIHRYAAQPLSAASTLADRRDRRGDGVVRIESLEFRDASGRPVDNVRSGQPMTVAIGLCGHADRVRVEDLALDIRITDLVGHPVATLSTRFGPGATGWAGRHAVLECQLDAVPLAASLYAVDLWLAYRGGLSDAVLRAGEFSVVPSDYYGTGQEPVPRKHGAALVDHRWTVRPAAEAGDLQPRAAETLTGS